MSAIDEYLKSLDYNTRLEFERIRKVIKTTVPEAEELIDYGIPSFKYKGKYLIGYYAYKSHLSLFPTSLPIERMKNKLSDFKLSKGTIQFSLKNSISDSIVRNLILYRIDDIDKSS